MKTADRDKASILDILIAARRVLSFSAELPRETLEEVEKQSAILYGFSQSA
ncbi:MAG: hypothetical protein AAGG02_03375 [Cyanobacteria bacterium P01_H01_bin.15]